LPFHISASSGSLEVAGADENEENFTITYEMILSFATGAPNPPPIGFMPPLSLGFHNESCFPRANTCSNTLYLPITTLNPSIEEFTYNIAHGIANSLGFGRV